MLPITARRGLGRVQDCRVAWDVVEELMAAKARRRVRGAICDVLHQLEHRTRARPTPPVRLPCCLQAAEAAEREHSPEYD